MSSEKSSYVWELRGIEDRNRELEEAGRELKEAIQISEICEVKTSVEKCQSVSAAPSKGLVDWFKKEDALRVEKRSHCETFFQTDFNQVENNTYKFKGLICTFVDGE